MANRKNQHIYSTALNDSTFRALKNITPDQKENLTVNELKFFSSDDTLYNLCRETTLDYRLYLLAKVGVSWTFRIERNAFEADLLEFNTQEQYDYPQKRVDVTEAASRSGTCVISSREVMFLSHMLAQNCTTGIYSISEASQILSAKVKNVRHLKGFDHEVQKAQEGYDTFNDIILEQLNSLDYAKETLGLDENDIRILSALYKKRSSALKMNEIAQLTKSVGRKMYFRKNMQKMLDAGYVYCDSKDLAKRWANSTYFMITTYGLNKIMTYQKFIMKQIFGG